MAWCLINAKPSPKATVWYIHFPVINIYSHIPVDQVIWTITNYWWFNFWCSVLFLYDYFCILWNIHLTHARSCSCCQSLSWVVFYAVVRSWACVSVPISSYLALPNSQKALNFWENVPCYNSIAIYNIFNSLIYFHFDVIMWPFLWYWLNTIGFEAALWMLIAQCFRWKVSAVTRLGKLKEFLTINRSKFFCWLGK